MMVNATHPFLSRSALDQALRDAVHGLQHAPCDAPWNAAEIADLLPEATGLAPAAVLVPVIRREQPTVLLTRRTEHLTHHAGQISFPGGRIEPGDADAVAAALRETEEEIGLSREFVDVLGYLDPFVTITGFRVSPVVALVEPRFVLRLDQQEVAEAFEVPLQFVLDPRNAQRRAREFRGRVRHYHVFEFDRREIWGATASMLVNFAERVRAVSRSA
jgi:8-oxo-dGTP pyrophosphatase MutT (NUDIX family)